MKADEKKCSDCAEVIKKDAAVCKHCGRRFSADEVAAGQRSLTTRKWGCAGAVVATLFLLAYLGNENSKNATVNSVAADRSVTANGAAVTATAPQSLWNYSERRDDMRNRTDKFAELASENEEEFSFPYNGGSHLNIELQKFRKNETDVLLRLDKGQFICHSFTGGSVSVRFDNGPVRKFGCSDTSDADTTTIFLHPAGSFLAALRKAKKVTVEADFYQEGVRQFTFDTTGLEWQ